MSSPPLTLNAVPNKPDESDLLNLHRKEIMLALNCHHVGTIQSFDSSKMTVTATINYTKTFFQLNPVTKSYVPVQVNYPLLLDCPIISISGGPVNLTMPIAKGDECLLLFNDRDIDNWYSSGQVGPVASSRLHSFSDAFALVGVKSTPNLLTSYDGTRALLTNGNVEVGVNPTNNKATIKNNSVGTLNSVLQNILTQLGQLCTQIETITVVVPGILSGPASTTSLVPSNAAAIAAISTQISTYATQLGNLIE